MDLTPGALFASFLVGSIGLVFFMHGKRQGETQPLVLGIWLMGMPYFVPGALAMVLVAAASMGGVWAWDRWA